jgi:hypothetical protein
MCGGFANLPCGPEQFCDFRANGCGAADETGTCIDRPRACDDNLDPVCGCDGVVHGNDCDAAASGTDINAAGGCPVEPGQRACGFRICDISATYCQHATSDVGGEPDGFACNAFPDCAVHDCACLATESCGGACEGDTTNGFTLTCFGG